jgi:2-polyprenyl-3-methyl-5-hydroxy-6-metoxy-1,4-benzoquinol methylase
MLESGQADSNESKYYQNKREELKYLIPDNSKRILEVGCGEGIFRTHFPEDVEYIGIEPSLHSVQVARKTLIEVHCGTLEEVKDAIKFECFDLAIANDVMEHSIDHEIFLEIIYSKLAHKSYFIGSIPNVRSFENLFHLIIGRDWKYTESGVLDYTHLRYFTCISLVRACKKAGFVNIKIFPINPLIPRGSLAVLKNLVIRTLAIIFGADIRYSQIAFSCEKD